MPTIGKIKVDLEGNTAQFQRNMRSATGSLTRFRRGLLSVQSTLGIVGGSFGFGLLAQRTLSEAVRMKQLADRVNTNVVGFSKLSRVLQRSGIGLNQTGTILQRLLRRAAEAAAGNEQLSAVFDQLGIDVQEFIQLDPVEAFLRFGEAIATVDNDAARLLATFKVLDTEGVQVLQADLAKLRQALEETPGVTEAQAEAVTKAAEAWDKLKESISSALLELGETTGFFGAATKAIDAFRAFIDPERQAARRSQIIPFQADLIAKLFRLAEKIPIIGPEPQGLGPPVITAPKTGTIGGGSVLQGGDLSKTNQLLEAIRQNTELTGAIFQ